MRCTNALAARHVATCVMLLVVCRDSRRGALRNSRYANRHFVTASSGNSLADGDVERTVLTLSGFRLGIWKNSDEEMHYCFRRLDTRYGTTRSR